MTDKKLQHLKEKYGEIFTVEIEDKKGWLRCPTNLEFFSFLDLEKEGELIKYESMINTLWIEGDEEIKTEDSYFIPLTQRLDLIFSLVDIEFKKLDDGNFLLIVNPTDDEKKKDQEKHLKFKPVDRKTYFEIKSMIGQSMYSALYTLFENTVINKVELNDKELRAVYLGLSQTLVMKEVSLKKN